MSAITVGCLRSHDTLRFSILGFSKVPKTFWAEKSFVKPRPANSAQLVFSCVVKGLKIKLSAKFRTSRHLRFEDTKGLCHPSRRFAQHLLKRSALHRDCAERLVGRVFVVTCFLTDSFYHFLGTSDTSEVRLGLKKPVGFLLSWPVGEQFKRHSRDSTSGSSRSFPFYFLPSLIWCTSLHVN